MPIPDWYISELPPLDIHVLSLAIVHEMEIALRHDLDRANVRYVSLPVVGDLSKLRGTLERLIGDYDRMRTDHIKFLRGELKRRVDLDLTTVWPIARQETG